MYSEKKSILQLVSLLHAHGITKMVLCPGSRNAPIVHSLSCHPDFECYSLTDERSAGFFALGLALKQQNAVAVCCTSGTALLNIHPAVCEAFYQKVPLVIISADRPAAWIGQMDGQTLPQPGVFGALVKVAVNLPEINTTEDEWYCNRLINQALLETEHHGRGPVHINIPLSEPLFNFTVSELPQVRVIHRYTHENLEEQKKEELLHVFRNSSRRMVVVGQHLPLYSKQDLDFFPIKQCAWISEQLGNLPLELFSLVHFDSALYAVSKEKQNALAPDLLITYGGHLVSKRLKTFLRKHPVKAHWHIATDGEVTDLFGSLTTIIEMNPLDFWKQMNAFTKEPWSDYPVLWESYCQELPSPMISFCELFAVGKFMEVLPSGSVLHLANSSVVRLAGAFQLPDGIEVYCNRGTSGIEGSLSTAVGFAAASDKLNFVFIGDLSFFYDMNALWNDYISKNIRILLLNNNGGGIFHTLPELDSDVNSMRFITAGHHTSARGWAQERGFSYYEVKNESDLNRVLPLWASPQSKSPMFVEVYTDKDTDAKFLKEYYHQLKTN